MAWRVGRSNRRRRITDLTDEDVLGLLEPGVEVDGTLKIARGMVRLNCHFKGSIHSEGMLVVADQGEIEGDIHAKLISITGKVKGSIHASERLEIKEHGVVLADIYAPSLVIDPGGYFDGQCHMPTPEPVKQTSTSVDSRDNP
jgi:cytoskeletal protein CcmA (bactofilin family)